MVNLEEFLKSQYFVDGKMFDTFCPLGPCIETELSLDDLEVECRVNGVVRHITIRRTCFSRRSNSSR